MSAIPTTAPVTERVARVLCREALKRGRWAPHDLDAETDRVWREYLP
jgi:hypothetical protein